MLLLPSPKESSNYFLTKSYSRFLASAPPRMSWGDGANPQTLRTSSMSLGCWTSRHSALVLVGMVLGILRDNQQPSVYSRVLLCPLHLSQLTFLCCSFPLLFFSLHFFPSPKYYKTLFPSYHSFFAASVLPIAFSY